MTKQGINWECRCDKCRWTWTTKSDELPKVCPACKRTSWNESETHPKEIGVDEYEAA